WLFTAENLPPWQKLDTGLELGLFPGRTSMGQPLQMVILRIDPKEYAFSVLTLTPEEEARSLDDWATLYQFAAVINASMYLPDGRTSTGYLRSGQQVNNERIVSRFGAFFVAEPDHADLPGAALLDRTTDPWEVLLPQYRYVVQNYRLISAERRLLWNPGGPRHSIAAVGRDNTGAILFIHCREPLTGVDFGTLLLSLPIDIHLVMYVEGGSQAGLLIRTPQRTQTWMGRHPADIWTTGNESAPLPNVIGIRKRPAPPPLP
ncbi:MAG: phosphodiester glycosidase family protein, partial [Bilophila sp.]